MSICRSKLFLDALFCSEVIFLFLVSICQSAQGINGFIKYNHILDSSGEIVSIFMIFGGFFVSISCFFLLLNIILKCRVIDYDSKPYFFYIVCSTFNLLFNMISIIFVIMFYLKLYSNNFEQKWDKDWYDYTTVILSVPFVIVITIRSIIFYMLEKDKH